MRWRLSITFHVADVWAKCATVSGLLLQHQQLPAEGAGTMTFLFRTMKHIAAVSAASDLERDPITSQLEVIVSYPFWFRRADSCVMSSMFYLDLYDRYYHSDKSWKKLFSFNTEHRISKYTDMVSSLKSNHFIRVSHFESLLWTIWFLTFLRPFSILPASCLLSPSFRLYNFLFLLHFPSSLHSCFTFFYPPLLISNWRPPSFPLGVSPALLCPQSPSGSNSSSPLPPVPEPTPSSLSAAERHLYVQGQIPLNFGFTKVNFHQVNVIARHWINQPCLKSLAGSALVDPVW